MNLKKLTYNGWLGSNTIDVFIQFTLHDYFVVESLVIKGMIQAALFYTPFVQYDTTFLVLYHEKIFFVTSDVIFIIYLLIPIELCFSNINSNLSMFHNTTTREFFFCVLLQATCSASRCQLR